MAVNLFLATQSSSTDIKMAPIPTDMKIPSSLAKPKSPLIEAQSVSKLSASPKNSTIDQDVTSLNDNVEGPEKEAENAEPTKSHPFPNGADLVYSTTPTPASPSELPKSPKHIADGGLEEVHSAQQTPDSLFLNNATSTESKNTEKSRSISSTSSLSSLSSSSPEPAHDVLLRQSLGNGSMRDAPSDDIGDSEGGAEKLSTVDVKVLSRPKFHILDPIEEATSLPSQSVSDNNLQVKAKPSSPSRKRRHSQGSDSLKRSKIDESRQKDFLKEEAKLEPTVQVECASDTPDSDGVESSASAHAKTEEDLQAQRKEAISYLTDIEVEFAKLRDRIHADKMARFIAEIEMCAEGTHPELESVYDQIQAHRDARIRRAEQRRKYQRVCIDNQTRAYRDQLHQQLLKDQADTQAKLLLQTTEEWYRVNRERRVMDTLVPEYGYRVSSHPAVQVKERAAQKNEITMLEELRQNVGFPAAPEIKPGTEDEVEEDLQMLGITGPSNESSHSQYLSQNSQRAHQPHR